MFKFAVLTISDSRSLSNDLSGEVLEQCIRSFGAECRFRELCSDDEDQIESKLRTLILQDVNCIITTGGTGFSKRDVTPEVTKKIIQKDAPGLVFALMEGSYKRTRMACLSRLTAGIANERLIINFPGKPKACQECFDILSSVFPHALQQLALNSAVSLHETPIKCCKHTNDSTIKNYKSTRESPFPMLSYDEAIVSIKQQCSLTKLNVITFEINQIHILKGHVLAENIYNILPFPSFPASTRDGYALIAEDGLGKRNVLESSDAGHVIDLVITSGKCAKISTGACVPSGANAVVQIEDTRLLSSTIDGKEKDIEILLQVKSGENIRPIGSDLEVGQIFKVGQKLNPVSIALLSSIGLKKIKVYQRPKVGIMSTGDEVIEPGKELPNKYCIYDSNRPLLKSLLIQDGYEFVDFGIAADTKHTLSNKFREALQICDMIVTSGGVSMGHKDYVKQILQQDFEAQIHFGRVDMKPGKPMTMATLEFNGKRKFVFGLPGNPVSVFVCYNVLFKYALSMLSGESNYEPQFVRKKLILQSPYLLDSRPEFLRVHIRDDHCVCTDFNQCSSRLYNSITANGLVFLPKSSQNQKHIYSGCNVDVLLL